MRAAELAAALDVSVPTLHRLLQATTEPILVTGKARRTRYALRRGVRGDAGDYPLYAVDEGGRVELVAHLTAVHPHGCLMPLTGTDWPLDAENREGWWDGLPYPLYDMRPQGYMGRQWAHAAHRDLGVPDHPSAWNDDDILFALSRLGADMTGNLILGDWAVARWQTDVLAPAEPIPEPETPATYAHLAEQALLAGGAGSSTAGEFPKFTARRALAGSLTPHVIVKFSGADGSNAVVRWADLLVSEHLALECARGLPGIESARSRILNHAGRTFLEVERFDRHGPLGRSPLCSLETLNAALLGMTPSAWPEHADALVAAKWLDEQDAQGIRHLWWLGRLIANTDMHLGNLSFRPRQGRLHLAPAYDQLPMRYAPLAGGELPSTEAEVPLPLPRERTVWLTASRAALDFWSRVSGDARISEGFRRLGRAHEHRLSDLMERV